MRKASTARPQQNTDTEPYLLDPDAFVANLAAPLHQLRASLGDGTRPEGLDTAMAAHLSSVRGTEDTARLGVYGLESTGTAAPAVPAVRRTNAEVVALGENGTALAGTLDAAYVTRATAARKLDAIISEFETEAGALAAVAQSQSQLDPVITMATDALTEGMSVVSTARGEMDTHTSTANALNPANAAGTPEAAVTVPAGLEGAVGANTNDGTSGANANGNGNGTGQGANTSAAGANGTGANNGGGTKNVDILGGNSNANSNGANSGKGGTDILGTSGGTGNRSTTTGGTKSTLSTGGTNFASMLTADEESLPDDPNLRAQVLMQYAALSAGVTLGETALSAGVSIGSSLIDNIAEVVMHGFDSAAEVATHGIDKLADLGTEAIDEAIGGDEDSTTNNGTKADTNGTGAAGTEGGGDKADKDDKGGTLFGGLGGDGADKPPATPAPAGTDNTPATGGVPAGGNSNSAPDPGVSLPPASQGNTSVIPPQGGTTGGTPTAGDPSAGGTGPVTTPVKPAPAETERPRRTGQGGVTTQ